MNTTLEVARPLRTPAPTPSTIAVQPTPATAFGPRRPATSRRLPLVLMAAGMSVVVGAVALVLTLGTSGPQSGHATGTIPSSPASTALTVGGPDDVRVHRMGYGPHESSNWHRHSGMHAIAVLSGTLTVYGPDCQPIRIAAGESYVGGQGLHLARNEMDEPVEMSVTYLFPQGVPPQNFVVPMAAPAACQLP